MEAETVKDFAAEEFPFFDRRQNSSGFHINGLVADPHFHGAWLKAGWARENANFGVNAFAGKHSGDKVRMAGGFADVAESFCLETGDPRQMIHAVLVVVLHLRDSSNSIFPRIV